MNESRMIVVSIVGTGIATITVIVAFIAILASGFNNRLNDLNGRIDYVNTNVNSRFDDVNNRIDDLNTSVNNRIDDLNTSVNNRMQEIETDIRELRTLVIEALKAENPEG